MQLPPPPLFLLPLLLLALALHCEAAPPQAVPAPPNRSPPAPPPSDVSVAPSPRAIIDASPSPPLLFSTPPPFDLPEQPHLSEHAPYGSLSSPPPAVEAPSNHCPPCGPLSSPPPADEAPSNYCPPCGPLSSPPPADKPRSGHCAPPVYLTTLHPLSASDSECNEHLSLLLSPCLSFVAGPPVGTDGTPSSACCHAFFPDIFATSALCVCHLKQHPFVSGISVDTTKLFALFPLCGTKTMQDAILWFHAACAAKEGHGDHNVPVPKFASTPAPATTMHQEESNYLWAVSLFLSTFVAVILVGLLFREVFIKEKYF